MNTSKYCGLIIFFDALRDKDWPHGCWACGIPNEAMYFGATPNKALAAWEQATK